MDLIQFLSDWLTYAADNLKARIPQRVWKIFGFHVIKHNEMHCKSYKCPLNKLVYVWPTQSRQSVKIVVCEKEVTIYSRNGSAGFRNLTQEWVSWSNPVSVETQTRVTKGQKLDRAEAIQTGVVYFQRYECLYLSVAYRYLRKEWNTVIKNEISNLGFCQKSSIQSFFR